MAKRKPAAPPVPPKASKPYGYRIKLVRAGFAEVCGVDYDCCPVVVAINEQAIVLRLPPRTAWNGNYQPRRYCPPEILVFRIIQDDGNGQYEVEPLIAWDTGRKPKPAEAQTACARRQTVQSLKQESVLIDAATK